MAQGLPDKTCLADSQNKKAMQQLKTFQWHIYCKLQILLRKKYQAHKCEARLIQMNICYQPDIENKRLTPAQLKTSHFDMEDK